MKTTFLIPFLFTVIIFTFSCNSDDDTVPQDDDAVAEETDTETDDTEDNTIVGRWKLIRFEDNGELFDTNECEQKSIVEFRSDDTFTDIAVIDDEMDNTVCVYDGFGISGTYVITDNVVVTTTTEVIAIPEDLNVPEFIEQAKGENDPKTISFEDDKLVLSETIQDGEETLSFKYTYEKTTDDFFEMQNKE